MILDQLQSAIADRYRVERELGRGGMATVFLATDIRHERQVAIKVLHPDLAATIGAERFEREIKLAAKLQHPHILGLYDSGAANGLLYYVMPFVEGESVRDKLDRDKQLSVDDAIQITLEVADALGYAHAQNIVHRDIKPENVMMSNGHALVADFGIARARTEAGQSKLTQTGMAVGTPVYMSPEQSTGEAVGPSADIYSLGCMLYEMLAGEPPFSGPNAMAIMARHAMEAVPSVRIVRPSVPEEVEEAILAAMEKNVADRPKTAAEFCEILGTPMGATATRRVTGRHTARHRVPTGARLPAFTTAEAKAAIPLWKRPMVMMAAVLTVIVGALGTWALVNGRSASASPTVGGYEATRIAVLYFDDQTDGKLGYLADNLTETLIDQLKQVRGLDVLSKDAVSRFRGSEVSIDSVLSVLKPGTLVRGSVSENGDRVRISFSVIDGNSGDDLGSRKGFEVPAGDLLAIRQIVSDSVATYLRDRVGKEVRARELEAGTTNREAFALVQRAEKLRRDAVSEVGRDSAAGWQKFTQADQLFAQAEGEDKKWANPIARRAVLALNEARAAKNALLSTPIVDRGVEHADRALKLDPNNPDALEARGRLRYERWNSQVDKDKAGTKLLEDARDDLVAVTKADPTRASALVALSTVYSQLHDAGQAYLAAQEAYNADAYLTGVESVLIQLFFTSYDREEFTQAVKWCRDEGFKRFPKDWRFTACQLLLRQAPGVVNTKIDSAWTEYQTLENVLPDGIKPFRTRQYRVFVAATIAKAGNRDSARHVLESVRAGKDIDPKGDLLTYEALVRPLLGTSADTAEAFKLVTDYVIGHPLHDFATTDHWWWRDLKKDPRWPKVGSGTSR